MRKFILLSFIGVLCALFSCKNSSVQDATAYVKEIDKGKIIFENGKEELIPNWGDPNTIFMIVVRHAEKKTDSEDPHLTLAGEMRAGRLAHLVKKVKVDEVITTNTIRTVLTGEPTAQMQACSFATYEAKNQDVMIRETLGKGQGKTFLVVGHTNTIPTLLNTLTKTNDYQDIPSNEFDNIYIVATRGITQTKVLHFKYK